MSASVFFISDLHLGHEGALRWARDYRQGNNVQEMNYWLIDQCNSVLTKRDTLYILGDLCFDNRDLKLVEQINCFKKHLILGNHDKFHLREYLKYFDTVRAYTRYKGYWVSHMPLHEYDMVNCRVKGNIHGHLHQNNIEDSRYFNVSIEQSNGVPRTLEQLLKRERQ